MTKKEKDLILGNLVKIESGIAKIYNRFSIKKEFSTPVRNFWRSIALEEELHADILDELRQAMNNDDILVTMNIDMEHLKDIVNKINDLVKKTQNETLSDSNAYSIAAMIEVELDEAKFTGMINTTDQRFISLLKKIENDTKKHRVMMVNYSRGIR